MPLLLPSHSARLQFGLWSSANIEDARTLWDDEEVTKYIGGPFDASAIDAKVRKEDETWASYGVQYWPMYMIDSGAFVGCCGLRPYHASNMYSDIKSAGSKPMSNTELRGGEGNIQKTCRDDDGGDAADNVSTRTRFTGSTSSGIACDGSDTVYELGFHITKVHWGKGLATEAARHVITFAFQELHASWLFAGHNPRNNASRLLLTNKLGFVFTHNEFYEPTGLMHPSYKLYPQIWAKVNS